MKSLLIVVLGLVLLCILPAEAPGADAPATEATATFYRHSLEVSPISPVFRIYAIQYGYMVTPKDELLVVPAYSNINYEFGFLRAPTLALGYRRYLWKNLHLEYQLWPSYSYFYDYDEKKWYEGFDLWNEFRAGYSFDFELGGVPLYVVPQVLFGFGLYPGNKPESFLEAARKEGIFIAPVAFLGFRF